MEKKRNIRILVEHVTRSFGEVEVLSDISIQMETGRIYGFVGRNGSGKTVLMKMICGLLAPTRGNIRFEGMTQKELEFPAASMGVLIENPGFLPEYSVFWNLKFLADIRGRIGEKTIRETIRMVGLDPDSRKHVGKYSLGMKERLGLAQAFMEDPPILILDEPMNGLDDGGVDDMRELILKQKEKGKLIIIASHSREDIGILCDIIFQFDHGKILEQKNFSP